MRGPELAREIYIVKVSFEATGIFMLCLYSASGAVRTILNLLFPVPDSPTQASDSVGN